VRQPLQAQLRRPGDDGDRRLPRPQPLRARGPAVPQGPALLAARPGGSAAAARRDLRLSRSQVPRRPSAGPTSSFFLLRPIPFFVIPALPRVIPAKAGIQKKQPPCTNL